MGRLLRRRHWAIATIAALFILPVATWQFSPERPAGASASAPDIALGATFHGFWNYSSQNEMSEALRSFTSAGGTWVRIDLGWGAVEPERDRYSQWALSGYDTAVDTAHAEGLNVLLVLQRTPSWANGSADHALAPRDAADFGDFAVDMANRYAGKVQAIELWNEPNHSQFFKARESQHEAQEHTAMVQDAYTKIKAAGPQGPDAVTVLAGGSSHVDVTWWGQLYDAGIQEYTDVVAVNPYLMPANLPPATEPNGTRYRMTALGDLIQLMGERGDQGKPIWFTEFGWSSHPDPPDAALWELGVTEAQQADFFEDTVALLEAEYPEVEQMFWYNLRNRDDSDSAHQRNFGLLNRDLTPKPVLDRIAEIYVGE